LTPRDAVAIIYESTPGRCGIRQLFIDAAIDTQTPDTLAKFRSALAKAPAEFLEDMACVTATKMSMRYARPIFEWDDCQCQYLSRHGWGADLDNAQAVCICPPAVQLEHHDLNHYMNWVDLEKLEADAADPSGELPPLPDDDDDEDEDDDD
jgi:hypothetical protein